MRASFFLSLGLALTACSSPSLIALPDDSGVTDSRPIGDAGAPDQGPSASDASHDVSDAGDAGDATEAQLAAPTFSPAAAALYPGSNVLIEAPPGFPADGVIYYSTGGQPPTATTGSVYEGPLLVWSAETVMALATAPGYRDSPVATAVYTIDALPDACCEGYIPSVTFSTPSQSSDTSFPVELSDIPGANICYTLDGTAPTCNAASVCTGKSLTYNQILQIGQTLAGDAGVAEGPGGLVTITAIACYPGNGSSSAVSQTYDLVLAPLYLASQNGDGAGLPGWDWSGTGKPLTTMAVPGDAGVPYGSFVAQQVGRLPCTSASSCSAPGYPLADFVCWSTTGPATCSCASPVPLTTATPYATLPASADVSPGGTLSVIACQASTPVNATGFYGPSSVTTVQF
jgi:hypothetical protein